MTVSGKVHTFSTSNSFWKYTRIRASAIGLGMLLVLSYFGAKGFLSDYFVSLFPILGVALLLLPMLFDSIIKPGFLELRLDEQKAKLRYYSTNKRTYLWLKESDIEEVVLGRNARLMINVHRAGTVAPLQLELFLYKDEENRKRIGTFGILDRDEFDDFRILVENLPQSQRPFIRVHG